MKDQIDTVVQRIYDRLSDDQSKRIFQNRLMYSFTKDYSFIMNIVNMLPQSRTLDKLISSTLSLSSELIMYGAGSDFARIKDAYPQIKFKYLCDRDPDKQANGWNGYEVISPQKLFSDEKDCNVLISSSKYWRGNIPRAD